MKEVLKSYSVYNFATGRATGCCATDTGLAHLGLQASDFPVGTIIQIIAIKPERRVVMPEGMRWIGENLFTAEGSRIASIYLKGFGWFRKPFEVNTCDIPDQPTQAAAQQKILEALADGNYYGVRWENVVDEEGIEK